MSLCLNLSTSLASHHPVTALQQERSKLGLDADHVGALEKLVGVLEAKSVAGVAKIHGRPRKARVGDLSIICSPGCHFSLAIATCLPLSMIPI
jgi:hypothetical protein